jgi:hypothetical protein
MRDGSRRPAVRPKILEWRIVYCKEMVVLGSRFPKEGCKTEAQLKDLMAKRAIWDGPFLLLASFER